MYTHNEREKCSVLWNDTAGGKNSVHCVLEVFMLTETLYFDWTECALPLTKLLIRIHSFTPLATAECDDSLPFSEASSIPLCYVIFPAKLLYQLIFHPLSPHRAIYFLVYLSVLLFPNSILGIIFPSILCTCRNQHNVFNFIGFIVVGF